MGIGFAFLEIGPSLPLLAALFLRRATGGEIITPIVVVDSAWVLLTLVLHRVTEGETITSIDFAWMLVQVTLELRRVAGGDVFTFVVVVDFAWVLVTLVLRRVAGGGIITSIVVLDFAWTMRILLVVALVLRRVAGGDCITPIVVVNFVWECDWRVKDNSVVSSWWI